MSRKPASKKANNSNEKKARKSGADPSDQDPKRRLGNFTTAGEHARQGGRNQGLVGQTKQKFGTDKRQKSSGKNQSR